MSISDNLIAWLADGERGISSNAIVEINTGMRVNRHQWYWNYPNDPADFRRCLLLLEQCPELSLECMRDVSRTWAMIVQQWKDITDTFLSEVPAEWRDRECSWSAPKTYDLMRLIIDGARP